jgi:hypothetical protein
MNVYALTPTGARPEGLALLGEYINAQTYRGPLTWIIVDDCDPGSRVPNVRDGIDVIRIRPDWRWRPGTSTQAPSMAAGLEDVPEDAVLFILEDDDVYLPGYLDTMLEAMETLDLAGEVDAQYYNVATSRWRVLPGKFHSSMASTVCKGDALARLRALCNGGPGRMLDVNLWKQFKGNKRLMVTHNVVGIKGLPGRPGIGVGHRDRFGVVDTSDTLRKWAGDYADNYDIFRVGI